MSENELSKIIVNTCYNIHVSLGPGLLESVYHNILCRELINQDLQVSSQRGIPVIWKGEKLNLGFRADIIINNKVLIEVKSVEIVAPVHKKQVLTYLKLSGIKLGLLVNFNEARIKDGICRIVNNL